MNNYSEPVYNYVFWVSSLPDSEMGPTGRMTHDLDQIFGASNIGFLHKRIRHVDELVNFLSCIKRCSANRGLRPLIHLDAHGNSEHGLYLTGQNCFYAWHLLIDLLREINIASQNNLALVGATCYGLNLIWKMQINKPTPFHVLLSPESEVYTGFLEENIPRFYQCLFQSGSFQYAYDSWLKDQFSYIHCEKVFFDALARYIGNCRGRALQNRKEELLTIALSDSEVNSLSKTEIRRVIREGIKPNEKLFDKYARTFLMGKDCRESIRNLIDNIMS